MMALTAGTLFPGALTHRWGTELRRVSTESYRNCKKNSDHLRSIYQAYTFKTLSVQRALIKSQPPNGWAYLRDDFNPEDFNSQYDARPQFL